MLCGCALCLARSLPKPPDILWDQHKGSFWEDEIQAAGAEASAPGPYCTWRKNGPKPVEQELLEGQGCGHGQWLGELLRFVCDDVNNHVGKQIWGLLTVRKTFKRFPTIRNKMA